MENCIWTESLPDFFYFGTLRMLFHCLLVWTASNYCKSIVTLIFVLLCNESFSFTCFKISFLFWIFSNLIIICIVVIFFLFILFEVCNPWKILSHSDRILLLLLFPTPLLVLGTLIAWMLNCFVLYYSSLRLHLIFLVDPPHSWFCSHSFYSLVLKVTDCFFLLNLIGW